MSGCHVNSKFFIPRTFVLLNFLFFNVCLLCMLYSFNKIFFLYRIMTLSNFDVKSCGYQFFNVYSSFLAKHHLETFAECHSALWYVFSVNAVFLIQNIVYNRIESFAYASQCFVNHSVEDKVKLLFKLRTRCTSWMKFCIQPCYQL